MHLLSPNLAALSVAVLFLILTSPFAFGGEVEIRPTTILITPAQRVGVLSLQNPDADAAIYQVTIYSWHQKGEEQILDPTNDVIASPPIISLAGHGSQIVRVALRAGEIPVEEQTYRLILEEVPVANPLRKPGLNIALRLSLPLFVRPQADMPATKLDADMAIANHKAVVTIRNQGRFTIRTVQAVLHAPDLHDADGIKTEQLIYIQPGNWGRYSFDLPATTETLHDATVALQTEEGTIDVAAPVISEAAHDGPTPTLH